MNIALNYRFSVVADAFLWDVYRVVSRSLIGGWVRAIS